MGGNVVIPRNEFMDVTLHFTHARLRGPGERNGPDMVSTFGADGRGIPSVFIWCPMYNTALVYGRHVLYHSGATARLKKGVQDRLS